MVAKMIKSKLKDEPRILNLIDFYLPLRQAAEVGVESEAEVEKELAEIDRLHDFDVPSAIDWDLLVVSQRHS